MANQNTNHIFRNIIIWLLIILLLLGGGGIAYLYFLDGITPGKILPNVYFSGVNLGGMTQEEAEAAVSKLADATFHRQTMQVQTMDQTLSLTPEQTGARIDAAAVAAEIYALGRSGSLTERKMQRQTAATEGYRLNVLDYLHLDTNTIRTELESFAKNFDSTLTQTTCELKGQAPDLSEESPDAGTQTLLITMGTPGYGFDTASVYDMVLNAYQSGQFLVNYALPVEDPDPLDLQSAFDEYCTQPVDAVMDMETFEVSAHQYGYEFDLSTAQKMVDQAQYGQQLQVPFYTIAPATTHDALASLLFRDQLGTYTAYASSSYNRDTNLRLACEAVNGIVIKPGEVFAYNPTLGERTPEAGYKEADSYWGNETIQTYGGGICQVSSSIYYCVMLADLEVVERYNHGFISSYMPFGMDATVDWSGPDFKFRNSSEYPIRIEAKANGGVVTVSLIGTDTKDYFVELEYEVLSVTDYETIEVPMEPDNEKGYKDGDVIVSPYTGYKITTYRCKYDKETEQLIERVWEATSNYSKRDKQVCKIIQPEETIGVPEETTATQ